MATILKFAPIGDIVRAPSEFRKIRDEFGLSVLQAAEALSVSAATLENWERNGCASITALGLREKYTFCASRGSSFQGENVLFGGYPMRFGRQVLQMSVDEMGAKAGYSKAAWLKIEGNARKLPDEKVELIENLVRARMAALCC